MTHASALFLVVSPSPSNGRSLNIFKAYQAIARHLELYPDDSSRFPNFKPEVPPLLVRGAKGPLGGEYHTAQYFHGRQGLIPQVSQSKPTHPVGMV